MKRLTIHFRFNIFKKGEKEQQLDVNIMNSKSQGERTRARQDPHL